MYTIGVDIGASSVKLAALSAEDEVLFAECRAHQGAPVVCVRGLIDLLGERLPVRECAGWAATGSGAQLMREVDAAAQLLEDVPAVCQGAQILAPGARSIIQMGAQSSLFVSSNADAGADAKAVWACAPQFSMNESCASGTGSFFEDQMGHLGLDIRDYSSLAEGAQSVPRLSGRCAVFAKTDIIHRQQEGVPVEDILLGLCYAMVKSYKATIVRGLPVQRPVALSGGVLANAGVVRAVREVFDLGEDELLASPENVFFSAVGAAAHARDADVGVGMGTRADVACMGVTNNKGGAGKKTACAAAHPLTLSQLFDALGEQVDAEPLPRLAALPEVSCEKSAGFTALPQPWDEGVGGLVDCALGVDVGSTSTNLVLLNQRGELLDAQYLRTRGNPKQALREGLTSLAQRLGNKVRVMCVGVTGSGRGMIGEFIGADAVRDEITAQARAAVAADAQVEAVFEIGGQDSKFIRLAGGQVADFQMNKICAAGTGSFVEEQAARLGIALSDYGPLALSAQAPIDLGERCTVFVETAINAALAKGATKADIAAGLCLSVVRNYLHRVVGTKPTGQRVVLQGGVAYNPGIVAAFKAYFGDEVCVSPWFAVSGAVGVALLALEDEVVSTAFRGFHLERPQQAARTIDRAKVEANRAFFRQLDDLFLEQYDGVLDPAKQTVGIPRCLMLHKLFPMANAFFKQLGYNVVLSDASNEETVRLSQQTAQGETCYPVKLVHGHLEQLARCGVDYVFMPSAHTIRHPKSQVAHNYACPYMQSAPMLAAKELDFEARGITLLSPLLEMDFGQQAIANALLEVGAQLGKTPQESARAMLAGGFAVQEFTRKTEELGERLLNSLEPGERVLVLITRNYGIVDPALNMGIPDALLDRGQKVITVSHLHAHDLDIAADYPGLYWPFGQHIVSGAKLVRRDPRLFAVYLTNHGCGPDTMVSHLFREEMGDKPYLQIEMDEHFSQVGVLTRIEAFLNTLDHFEARDERALPLSTSRFDVPLARVDARAPVALPSFGIYGPLAASWFARRGVQVQLMQPDEHAISAGQKCTTTKEYLSFTALLGMSLRAAKAAVSLHDQPCECFASKGLNADKPLQILLPSTEGAEADGIYDRVIRTILDEQGHADVQLRTRKLDQLPWQVDDAEGLFALLLAGDVLYAAPVDMRAALLDEFAAAGCTFACVLAAAKCVGAAAARAVSERTALALVGEWPVVFGDELTGGMWARLEQEGYRVVRMPFSEYLWFLWADARAADEHEKSDAPFMLDASPRGVMDLPLVADCTGGCGECDSSCVSACGGETSAVTNGQAASSSTLPPAPKPFAAVSLAEKDVRLAAFAAQMADMHHALGEASPFSGDLDALRQGADDAVGAFRGANGRYRAAKAREFSRVTDGVLVVASMYENTDIALKLLEEADDFDAPVLHLVFDGALDQGIEEKLHSFLYYI